MGKKVRQYGTKYNSQRQLALSVIVARGQREKYDTRDKGKNQRIFLLFRDCAPPPKESLPPPVS